jgi:hypothetical protein
VQVRGLTRSYEVDAGQRGCCTPLLYERQPPMLTVNILRCVERIDYARALGDVYQASSVRVGLPAF